MKKLFILHVLLCFWLWGYAQVYENNQGERRIGYTTNYGNSFGQTTSSYNITYDNYSGPSYAPSSGRPRKVSGFDGGLFWLLWGRSHGVPSSASNEDMYAYYEYIQNGGTKSWDEWFNFPDDPFATPIGDVPVLLIAGFIIFYLLKLKPRRNNL